MPPAGQFETITPIAARRFPASHRLTSRQFTQNDRTKMVAKVTVLGSGAMGTGCSILLADRPDESVTLWSRTPAVAAEISEFRENRRLLPGVILPESIRITSDLAEAVA